jgi:hypothetical protein
MRTKSEELFESFLTANKLPFEKIKEDTSSRPDYLVFIGDLKLLFEMKELAEDENFGVVKDQAYPHIKMHSRTPGDHVRRRIEGSKKQIQYGAKQGFPSILLIYNNLDPALQMFGTEDLDFTTAMYGELKRLLTERPERHPTSSAVTSSCFNRTRTRPSALWVDCATGAEK